MRPTQAVIAARLNPGTATSFAICVGLALLWFMPGHASALPQGYAYEMVSPPAKNGGVVEWEVGFRAGGGAVSDSGDRVAYTSRTAFGGAEANAITNSYMGIAPGSGETAWSALPITPPFGSSLGPISSPGQAPILWTSKDLTKLVVNTNVDPQTYERQPRLNLYLRDLTKQPAEYVQLTPDPVAGPLNYYDNIATQLRIKSATPTLDSLVYTTTADLTPDSVGLSGTKAYVVETSTGEVTLASIAGGSPGTPVTVGSGTALGTNTHNQNVLSDDGRYLIFDANEGAEPGLHRRDLVAENTVVVNEAENSGESIPLADATFLDATPDGRFVFFRSDQRLVDADTNAGPDLYRWDAEAPEGERLTLVSVDSEPADGTEGGVGATIGTSEDGSRVYFTTGGPASAPEQLVEGAPTVPTGDSFLFYWENGVIKYVGSADEENYATTGNQRPASSAVSPDGSYMALIVGDEFFGTPPLTPPGDNGSGQQEVYLYDAEASTPLSPETACVSCDPEPGLQSDRDPFGRSYFTYDTVFGMYEPDAKSFVSNDGRVVFTTPSALVRQDANGDRYDVYTYKGGVTELVSSGRDPKDSHLFGGSRDLSTIAFTTAERLVGWDVDRAHDAYVAKLGGGLPEPDLGEAPCIGSECQGGAPAAPSDVDPGSGRLDGEGNPSAGVDRDRGAAQRCKRLAKKGKKLSKRARTLERRAKRADGRRGKRLQARSAKQRKRAKRLRKKASRCRQVNR